MRERLQSSTGAVSGALETTTHSGNKDTDIKVPDKGKQWTMEEKLEFFWILLQTLELIDLYKEYKNKAKAARELKARYKF